MSLLTFPGLGTLPWAFVGLAEAALLVRGVEAAWGRAGDGADPSALTPRRRIIYGREAVPGAAYARPSAIREANLSAAAPIGPCDPARFALPGRSVCEVLAIREAPSERRRADRAPDPVCFQPCRSLELPHGGGCHNPVKAGDNMVEVPEPGKMLALGGRWSRCCCLRRLAAIELRRRGDDRARAQPAARHHPRWCAHRGGGVPPGERDVPWRSARRGLRRVGRRGRH